MDGREAERRAGLPPWPGSKMTPLLPRAQAMIAAQPQARTLRGVDEHGRVFWVKRASAAKTRLWHVLQSIIAQVLRAGILRPTAGPGGPTALHAEAQRLRDFAAAGLRVPTILAEAEDFLILSDIGPAVAELLRDDPDPVRRYSLMEHAILTLAALHAGGRAHGRPYLRDMTWADGQIGFLDLEENPQSVMPLHQAQARDVWIFLCAAARHTDDAGMDALFRAYTRRHRDPAQMESLHRLIRLLHPPARLLTHLGQKRVGRDVRQAVCATQCLHRTLK